MKKRAVILQSGGATAVINQSLAGVVESAKKSGKFGQFFGAKHGVLGILNHDLIRLDTLSHQMLDLLKRTPSSALGTCRHKLSADEARRIATNLKKRHIDTLFLIGGNDTARTALRLHEEKKYHPSLQVIGIPKTIDNDLPGMDHAPGYGSVARFMALTTQEASLDTRAARLTDPIKIIETMGRNSGWIVASSALGNRRPEDGPHLLYFPERAFDEAGFIKDVRQTYRRFGCAVIVISETIRDKYGNRIGSQNEVMARDKFGHPYIEGAAQHLSRLIQSKLKIRARFDKPGTIQRMAIGYVSTTDQKEAYGCGRHAVSLALQGKTNVMVAMIRTSSSPYRIRYSDIPLSQVAGREKTMPDSFINRNGNFITPAFRRYALPLLGGKLPEYAFL